MKKSITVILIFFTLMSGCQDELDERYLNPDKNTSTTVDKLFTGMLNNNRVWPMYWEASTFINWHVGIYAQTVGFLNSPTMYQQNESYIQDRWTDFYRPSSNGAGVVMLYRQMQSIYKKLKPSEQVKADLFMQAARVVLYDQATQMIDLWGDIPFSQAGSLAQTDLLTYPKFDDSKSVYIEAINELKLIGEYFANITADSESRALFERQDILLYGSLEQWRRYANSLRMRLLMRISFSDEEFARTQVMNMLVDPVRYPLLNTISYRPGHDDVLLTPLKSYSQDLHDAFNDWINYPAPYHMLENVLKPAHDLRIKVLFDKYGSIENNKFIQNEEYRALPLNISRVDQLATLTQYSIIDSTTFLFNNKLPGVIITVAEINFLKAEAFERWGGGDAENEYKNGIKSSVQFYYYLNGLNTTRSIETAPDDASLEQFVNEENTLAYDGTVNNKLNKIATQKWVHLGFLQSVQAWTEFRRTGYPMLNFPVAASDLNQPPARLTYPLNEKTFNPNYREIAPRDTRQGKIFWADF